ncbi:MAG: hypothetical protein KBC94_07915 [Pseudacidovorax sp.]|uniref:hypothetical protein n=1 Tax=Pseudacidovorax sp. TaxID=1934311 RepID=UPI001B53F760|nr:hypothetical protein [Pseudacidovorax sp.]MBP6894333.1 hypothetical protein [Pseudacidovorax sp.]
MTSILDTLAIAALVAVGALIGGYAVGHQQGAASVQQQWDKAKASTAQAITAQVTTTREKETTHASQSTQAVDTYRAAQASADAAAAARVADAERLQRGAEGRALRYRAMSEASAAERDRLASHAAQLDASLAEGRVVAEQLRAAVVERDGRIQLLADTIRADRQLFDPSAGAGSQPEP